VPAEQHLSTEMIDQTAWRIEMYLAAEVLHKGDKEGAFKWYDQWEAELNHSKDP
jgi:hypothetical protein